MIYIGKTESGQIERDAKQHLASGETGRSTLRRSLGALLIDVLDLRPEPRSLTETSDRRFTNYKFDPEGEIRLTDWMMANLGFSFYEYDRLPTEIAALERSLIHLAKPVLNLKDNPDNLRCSGIQTARRRCATMARENHLAITGCANSVPARKTDAEPPIARKLKLHEAMAVVLQDCPGRTATFKGVADEIARQGLYRQQSGGDAPPSQIRLRAKNYDHLFEIIRPDRVRLKWDALPDDP